MIPITKILLICPHFNIPRKYYTRNCETVNINTERHCYCYFLCMDRRALLICCLL